MNNCRGRGPRWVEPRLWDSSAIASVPLLAEPAVKADPPTSVLDLENRATECALARGHDDRGVVDRFGGGPRRLHDLGTRRLGRARQRRSDHAISAPAERDCARRRPSQQAAKRLFDAHPSAHGGHTDAHQRGIGDGDADPRLAAKRDHGLPQTARRKIDLMLLLGLGRRGNRVQSPAAATPKMLRIIGLSGSVAVGLPTLIREDFQARAQALAILGS